MNLFKTILLCLMLTSVSACYNPINDLKEKFGLEKAKPLPADMKAEMGTETEPTKITAGELARENSELLAEMNKVIFNEADVDNKTDFGNLVLTLNQGASLEGIYRGLVMGSRYRALETKSQAANPTELKAFANEMAELQDSMKNPSEFTSEEKKAPSIEYPDGSESVPTVHAGSQDVEKKKDKAIVRDELLQTFIGASGYTLKRVLCDEALKKFDEMKDDRGDMAQWYAKLVIRLAASKVDFGLALRNQADFDFHFKFAQKMATDRVKWEVLNRYHRYLNFTATQ